MDHRYHASWIHNLLLDVPTALLLANLHEEPLDAPHTLLVKLDNLALQVSEQFIFVGMARDLLLLHHDAA